VSVQNKGLVSPIFLVLLITVTHAYVKVGLISMRVTPMNISLPPFVDVNPVWYKRCPGLLKTRFVNF